MQMGPMPRTTAYNCRSSGDSSYRLQCHSTDAAGLSLNIRISCSRNPLGVGQLSDLSVTGHTIGIAITCDGHTAGFAMHQGPTPSLHIIVLLLHSQTSRFARSGPSESALLQRRTKAEPASISTHSYEKPLPTMISDRREPHRQPHVGGTELAISDFRIGST